MRENNIFLPYLFESFNVESFHIRRKFDRIQNWLDRWARVWRSGWARVALGRAELGCRDRPIVGDSSRCECSNLTYQGQTNNVKRNKKQRCKQQKDTLGNPVVEVSGTSTWVVSRTSRIENPRMEWFFDHEEKRIG
jgi:hypothetical protein